MKGSQIDRQGFKVPSYPKDRFDGIESTYAQGNLINAVEPKEIKIAEGLGKIKESYDHIRSVYAQDSTATPIQKEMKIAEGLGKIKESYDHVKSQYTQDKNILPPKEAAKIAEGLGRIKETYNHIKSAYA